MKPLVVHLIGDKLPGGSNFYVERLVNSELKQKYEFNVATLEEFQAIAREKRPDLIVFHYPCKWRYLIQLISLKSCAKLIILDHHYCQGFELDSVATLWRFHLMLKLAYAIADRLICVSQAQKEWVLARRLVAPQKVRVLPISVSGAATIEDLLEIPPKNPSKPLVLGSLCLPERFRYFVRCDRIITRNRFFSLFGRLWL